MYRYSYMLVSILMLVLGLTLGFMLCYVQLQPEIGRLSSIIEAMVEELSYMEEARLELMNRLSELEEAINIVSGRYEKLVGSINITVELLPDRSYLEKAYRLIANAKSSIYLVMYAVESNPMDEGNPANILIDTLIHAYLRGVNVKVLFDEETAFNYPETIAKLKSYGIPVRLDGDKAIATHSKLLVVDGFYVLAGSHDWTKNSLNRNYEYSIMIASSIYGSEALSYAEDTWSKGYDA
ncbi:MAG: phospholipase D-like domain-containing protein [Candidatus Bathyarchaeota archaeon]|nr:phospholipase D-like domain-containing protein [Candidatus Bathyarchaeota archaeon]